MGGLTGQGGNLLILDDYCAGREDAESQTLRDKTCEVFSDNFMTRRAPVSIVLILATRWHIDDVIGRVKRSMREDPSYPRFEDVNIPAFSDTYPLGVLFPERFPISWYEEQRAVLGEYGAASLLQGEPMARGGNRFHIDRVQEASAADFPESKYYRVFDLAHTKKERDKSDPDYTVGTLLTFRKDESGAWHLWIKDIWRVQLDAPERDAGIRALSDADREDVAYSIERSSDSQDAFKVLAKTLEGKRKVTTGRMKGDKSIRAMPLEPIFQAGHVHILRGAAWKYDFLSEAGAFPHGAHDDIIDTLSLGYYIVCMRGEGFYESEKTKAWIAGMREKREQAEILKDWIGKKD